MQVTRGYDSPVLGRDYRGQNCSIARALEVVGERWTLLIVRDAFLGVTRFDGFARKLGIAPNVLAKRLETLVDAGVLERRRYQDAPVRHEYVLTRCGRDLFPVVISLLCWGDRHLAEKGPPVVPTHVDCEGELGPGAICARCGERVGPEQTAWLWGPGSSREPGTVAAGPLPAA